MSRLAHLLRQHLAAVVCAIVIGAGTCIGVGSAGTLADLSLGYDVVDVRDLPNKADRCRVARHFEGDPTDRLEPEGLCRSLLTPGYADDGNARQKKETRGLGLRRADSPGFPGDRRCDGR